MKVNLESRIKTILCGRKIHTWGNKIGLSRGIIHNLNKAKLPNADKLGPIIRAENVSLSWLIEGIGSPYLVQHCHSDDECCDYLDELYAEQWKTHLLVDGLNMALVLQQNGSYDVDGTTYLSLIFEVITGPIGNKTLARMEKQTTESNAFFVETSVVDMRDLARGLVGTYGLWSTPDALLNKARPLSRGEIESFTRYDGVAEEKNICQGVGKVSSEEMATVEYMRQLNSENLTHMRRLYVRLLTRQIAKKQRVN